MRVSWRLRAVARPVLRRGEVRNRMFNRCSHLFAERSYFVDANAYIKQLNVSPSGCKRFCTIPKAPSDKALLCLVRPSDDALVLGVKYRGSTAEGCLAQIL